METICKSMESLIVNSSDPYSVWPEESHGILSGSPASIYSDYPLHQPSTSPAPRTRPTALPKSLQSKKKGLGHISRPPNAFILFRSDFWALEKRKPRPVGRDHRDISRIAAHCWRELSGEAKQMYYDKAQQLRELHKLQYPDYQLRPAPRRSRISKRKTDGTLAAEERCRRLASSIMDNAISTVLPISHPIPQHADQLAPLPWVVDNSPNTVSPPPAPNHPGTLMNAETREFPAWPIDPSVYAPSDTFPPQLQLELQPLLAYDHPQVSLLLDGANSIPPLPSSDEDYFSTTQSWYMPFQGAELQCSLADVQYWSESVAPASGSAADTAYTFDDFFSKFS